MFILKIGKREASVIYTGIQSFRRPVQCTAQFCANLKIRVAYEEQFSSLSPLEQIFGGKFGNLTAEIKLARSFRLYTELAGHTPTGQNDKLCLQFL